MLEKKIISNVFYLILPKDKTFFSILIAFHACRQNDFVSFLTQFSQNCTKTKNFYVNTMKS